MAKKLIEFVKEQARKAGINVEDDALKSFFATEVLSSIEIPDEITKPIESSLISLTDAKNNHQDIKNHYTKQALDGLDKNVDALMDQLGLSEDEKNAIKVERNSYKKPELLIKTIQTLEQKKANADKPDRAAIQKQIDDLHAQLREEKGAKDKVIAEYAAKEKQMKINYKLESLLSGHKTINDHLEADTRAAIVHTLLTKRLQDNNAKFDLDEHGNVVLLKNDGTNFYGESNTQVNAKQFVEQTLSANKLLVVQTQQQNSSAGSGANGQQSQNGQNGAAPASGSGNKTGASSTYRELMNRAKADAAQGSPVMPG